MEKKLVIFNMKLGVFIFLTAMLSCCMFKHKPKEDNLKDLNKQVVSCTSYYDSCFQRQVYSLKNVDTLPKFKGDELDVYHYVSNRLRYSVSEYNENEGKLFLMFIVETDGTITDIKSGNNCSRSFTKLEKKLADIIIDMPAWSPGYCDEKAVPTVYKLPITF